MVLFQENEELVEQQLRQAQRNAVTAELAAAGLQGVGHPMLLWILRCSSGASDGEVQAQRDLAERLNISPAAVATSLKSMERCGYIRREPGEGDARRNRVMITEKGRVAVEGCRDAIQRVNRRMVAGFTPEERRQIDDFRRRMLQNLQNEGRKVPDEKEDTACSNCL